MNPKLGGWSHASKKIARETNKAARMLGAFGRWKLFQEIRQFLHQEPVVVQACRLLPVVVPRESDSELFEDLHHTRITRKVLQKSLSFVVFAVNVPAVSEERFKNDQEVLLPTLVAFSQTQTGVMKRCVSDAVRFAHHFRNVFHQQLRHGNVPVSDGNKQRALVALQVIFVHEKHLAHLLSRHFWRELFHFLRYFWLEIWNFFCVFTTV